MKQQKRKITKKKTNKRYKFKIQTYFEITKKIANLSQSSSLKVGAIALKKDFTSIASFGYNGSYSGAPINEITGTDEDSLEPGKSGYIHAEINLIAKFREKDPENYIIILTHSPCLMCLKTLINAGFKNIFWNETYRVSSHLKILEKLDINFGTIEDLKKKKN